MSEYQIVLDYLIENNLIEYIEDADNFIEIMSDNWIEAVLDEGFSYLTEKRRLKAEGGKVVKREKTPLYREPATRFSQLPRAQRQRGAVARDKDTGSWKITRQTDAPEYHTPIQGTMTPAAAIGRAKQGMLSPGHQRMMDTGKAQYGHNVDMPSMHTVKVNQPNVFIEPSYPRGTRHAHGGKSLGMGEVGRLRGRKKVKGAKSSEETPVSRFLRHKQSTQELNARLKQPMSRLERQQLGDMMSSVGGGPLSAARRRAARRRASRG